MAGFVVSPNTVAVKLHWTLHGRAQLNVLHALNTAAGPLNPNSAQNIFASIETALTGTGYINNLATTTTLAAVGVLDLRSEGVPEILSTGTPVPGTGAGNALPDSTSLVLTERTGLTGRAHRGRIYTLGWVTGTVLADGTASPAAATAAQQWYQALQSAIGAQGWQLAIRSTAKPDRPSKPGGTLPSKPYEITPVTSIEVRDLIFDTNRRRADQLHR